MTTEQNMCNSNRPLQLLRKDKPNKHIDVEII